MAWQIDYTRQAQRQLAKLDKAAVRRILDYMDQQVASQTDPRSLGKALTGAKLGSYWRYRVGDYRIICDIQDGILHVLVISIGIVNKSIENLEVTNRDLGLRSASAKSMLTKLTSRALNNCSRSAG